MPLVATNIQKRFGGFTALQQVSLECRPGEIHALLGANGSGKSTLVKILSGVQLPDAGVLNIGAGSLSGFASPASAHASGIAVVHQDAPLIDTLSIAECIALFRGYPTAAGRILWRSVLRETEALLQCHGLDLQPHARAGSLAPAQRALLSLAIALDQAQTAASGRKLELLILDEVTAALPERQAELFLNRARALANGGLAVLMVTHRLAELDRRADRVTVLRGGRVVHAGAFAEGSREALVAQMSGAPTALRPADDGTRAALHRLWALARAPAPEATASASARAPALAFEEVETDQLRKLDWSVAPGEIAGIAGLSENGVHDVPALLAGRLRPSSGRILVGGRPLPAGAGPRETIAAGVTVLPADRLHEGGVGSLSVSDNMVLPATGRWWHRARAREAADALLGDLLDVTPRASAARFGTLSGGNQQKVLLGKWLLLAPRVLVLDDPTQGVDPGAREMIFQVVQRAAETGIAVLVLSTEPEQLVRLCRRVLVLQRDRTAELSGAALTYQRMTELCYA